MSNALSYYNFFPYSWHYADEEFGGGTNKQCIIRVFGWNEKNETMCVKITDFNIPVWVEFPEGEDWTEGKRAAVANYFRKLNRDPNCQPINIKYQLKEKLYNANITLDEKNNKYKRKLYPILQLDFKTSKGASFFNYALKDPIRINELGSKPYKFIVHTSSNSITPVLKCMATYNLPSAGWIRGRGRLQTGENKESTKMYEYITSCKDLTAHPSPGTFPIVYPKVLSWDIETFSTDENSMPKVDRWEDVIFLIGCVFSEYKLNPVTKTREKVITKYCLSTVDVDEKTVHSDTKVIKFKNEYALLKGFAEFIRKEDPDVLIGYNIMGYDLKYMIARAQNIHSCFSEFANISCIPGKIAKEEKINWGSSARGKQDMVYLEANGRMWIDMLPYIRMNNNFGSYKLTSVCQEILKTEDKDDLKIKDMFRYYREKDPIGLATAVNYCTQDSNVVLLLWEKCLTWFDLTETSTVCCVPPFYIVAKAQQIRIVSQMLNYCMKYNILLETSIYKADENTYVEGAYVSHPIPGLYKNICPQDFASLYPSIIRAYNIDYTTLVTDESIPDEDCNIVEWETHLSCNCPKSDGKKPTKNKNGTLRVICNKYRIRWLKDNDKGHKGIIPTLIKNLLDARKTARKVMEKNADIIKELEDHISDDIKEQIEILKKNPTEQNKAKMKLIRYQNLPLENKKKIEELESINSVYNKKQLAFKVSANSMYGILGAAAGYLPLLYGAMSVTAVGRQSIIKVSNYIAQNHGGRIIYNDTDSAYCEFSDLNDKSNEEIWKHAENVASDTSKLFPPPMKLEFENAIYSRFLIFSKKRYVGLISDIEGNIDKKWKISGIVLKRRDGCAVLRDLYKSMIEFVLYNADELTKLKHIQNHNQMIEDYKIAKRGVTIKKRKDESDTNDKLTKMENQMKQWETISRSNPTVRKLMELVDNYISDMFLMNKYKPKDYSVTKSLTKDEYAAKTLPAHVAVSNKLKERGQIVQANDRISYILLDKGLKPGTVETQNDKAEDFYYYIENCEWLRLDYLYYLEKQIIIPCDQIFSVACGVHNFVESLYNYRFNHKIMLYSLKQKFKPRITYEEM